MLTARPFWIRKIQHLLTQKPIVWIAGPRRTGKTTLVKSLTNTHYLNCDLPRIQNDLSDPEQYFKNRKGTFVLDEIHQLENPSLVLKIVSDEMPLVKIIATGSSTILADSKFKDTLTDRKRNMVFPPVLLNELQNFGNIPLIDRLLKGGCPPALLSEKLNEEFYAEWMDSFYSKDIQKLFAIEKKQPFIRTLQILFQNNANLLDVSELARECGLSRPTVTKYLDILEVSQAIRVLRPWHDKNEAEYTNRAKVYGFDTGFVNFAKGIDKLRPDDEGYLLENLVLDMLLALFRPDQLYYWRLKNNQEIDFVIKDRSKLHVIEVKRERATFDPSAVLSFRKSYPAGENFLIYSSAAKKLRAKTQSFDLESRSIFEAFEALAQLADVKMPKTSI